MDAQDSSRFEAKAEDILEALAQSARLHSPGQAAAAPVDDRPSGRERPGLPAEQGDTALGSTGIGGAERHEDPFSTLNQARLTYDSAQERQRAVLRQPGSLLDFEA